MEWYKNMTEKQKRNFKKVIVVFVTGSIMVLLVPAILNYIF